MWKMTPAEVEIVRHRKSSIGYFSSRIEVKELLPYDKSLFSTSNQVSLIDFDTLSIKLLVFTCMPFIYTVPTDDTGQVTRSFDDRIRLTTFLAGDLYQWSPYYWFLQRADLLCIDKSKVLLGLVFDSSISRLMLLCKGFFRKTLSEQLSRTALCHVCLICSFRFYMQVR